MAWRVLIVEDEFLIALDYESGFRDAGAEIVGPLRKLAEALATPLDSFDAAVLDAKLEDGFCYPFAMRLLEAGIPFVIATGRSRDDLPEELKGVPCLDKPLDAETLVHTLTARAAVLGKPATLIPSECDERAMVRLPSRFDSGNRRSDRRTGGKH
jgi:DNA-binding response OmpR family regulator